MIQLNQFKSYLGQPLRGFFLFKVIASFTTIYNLA